MSRANLVLLLGVKTSLEYKWMRGNVRPEANPDRNSENLNIQAMSVKMRMMEVNMKSMQDTARDLILLQCSSAGMTRELERAPSSCMWSGSETSAAESGGVAAGRRRKWSWVSSQYLAIPELGKIIHLGFAHQTFDSFHCPRINGLLVRVSGFNYSKH